MRVSPLQRVAALRHDHRLAAPLLPATFGRMRLAPSDVVLCSSSGWAHGVRTGATPKVVYCHTPARWLHVAPNARALLAAEAGPLSRLLLGAGRGRLLAWDRRAAAGASCYLANSSVVRERISSAYGRVAEVLPPPPGLLPDGPEQPSPGVEPGFFLVVARLLAYKNVGVVIEAVRAIAGARLVVVGDGPLRHRLQAGAPPGVQFRSGIDDTELRWLYRNAAALVTASHEDFGLTPLEANAFGRPVVALRAGGHLDTVLPGLTGLFVEEPDPRAFAVALQRCATGDWDDDLLRRHSAGFGRDRFDARLQEVVAELAGQRR